MKRERGDIWALQQSMHGALVVVPVNCGFNDSGIAIMGAGVAKQAAERFRWLRATWGTYCLGAYHAGVLPDPHVDWTSRTILVPTKGCRRENPALSWSLPGDLALVELGLVWLRTFSISWFRTEERILLPLIGCGLGGLSQSDVVPLLEKYLDDRFTLVDYVETGDRTWSSSRETTRR